MENAAYTFEQLFYKAVQDNPDNAGSAVEKAKHRVLKVTELPQFLILCQDYIYAEITVLNVTSCVRSVVQQNAHHDYRSSPSSCGQ